MDSIKPEDRSRKARSRSEPTQKLSPLQRKQIAQNAAAARWGGRGFRENGNAIHPYSAMEPRQATLVAAAHLFAARGYEEPTMKEIAAAAGVGLQTVYRFFPAKRTLYLEVCVSLQQKMMAYFDWLLDLNVGADAKIMALALGVSHTHAHTHIIRLAHWKLLEAPSSILHEPAGTYWARHYDRYTAVMHELYPERADAKTLELIGGILGMAQYATVMGELDIVERFLGGTEQIAIFCLSNALPTIDWSSVRQGVIFTDFDLAVIGSL